MPQDNQTDMTEMFAVHDCLRHEFARLPLTVKAVAEGDSDRASVVGGHVMMMTSMLHAHHEGEDLLVWPLLAERSPAGLPFAAIGKSATRQGSRTIV